MNRRSPRYGIETICGVAETASPRLWQEMPEPYKGLFSRLWINTEDPEVSILFRYCGIFSVDRICYVQG